MVWKVWRSAAFPPGEFHFPNAEAAAIAVQTVTGFLRQNTPDKKVIFNVFKDTDRQIYEQLLRPDCKPAHSAG